MGKINMIGYKNEYLEVIEELPYRTNDNKILYKCRCSCGNIFKAIGTHIRRGDVKSCGCYRYKILSSQGQKMLNIMKLKVDYGKFGVV